MCSKNTLQIILDDITNKMIELFNEKLCRVVLFGSYARGDYSDESDIDVFVMVDMEAADLAAYRDTVSDILFEINLEYDVMLSIKLQDKETFDKWENTLPFFINVKREGVPVYAA